MLISWLRIRRFKQTSCGGFWDGGISGAWMFPLLRSLSWQALISLHEEGLWPSDNVSWWPEGSLHWLQIWTNAPAPVWELATILILFVRTDPIPFYFQLVENKLVLFLLIVAMTTLPFLFFFFGESREVNEGKSGPFSVGLSISRLLRILVRLFIIIIIILS